MIPIKKYFTTLLFISFFFSSQAQWVQKGDNIYGQMNNSHLGSVVSLNGMGNIIAINAVGESSSVELEEQVQVLEWDGVNWVQLGSMISNGSINHDFGTSIATDDSGLTLIIGAPQVFNTETGIGYAQVYQWDGTDWTQKGQDIVGESSLMDDHVGTAVDISADGNTVVVGAYGSDLEVSDAGACSIYTWDGSDWIQKGDVLTGYGMLNWFGYTVSISADGNVLAVGSYGYGFSPDSAQGQVTLYAWDGADWIQIGSPISGTLDTGKFGVSTKINDAGDQVIIGTTTGNALVYHWNGTAWNPVGEMIETDGSGFVLTSYVDINAVGDVIIVGIPRHDGIGDMGYIDGGQTKIYQWNGTMWVQIGEDFYGEDIFDFFGKVSISSEGNIVAIGGAGNNYNGQNLGYTRVFEQDSSLVNINEYPENTMVVYPNPNNGTFTIQINEELVQVTIYSIEGKVIRKQVGLAGNKFIQIADLETGVYYVSVLSKDDKVSTVRLIVF